jgi:predicted GTPase
MPYNDLSATVQRFEDPEDLDTYHVTVEEREEYEGHLGRNFVLFTGVDYKAILAEAEKEGDVIICDGGDNDWSFYKPDVNIVVADPMRQGHESRYYLGETNVRMADIVVVNKVNVAPRGDVEKTVQSCAKLNPRAKVIRTRSEAVLDHPDWIRGKRAAVVEDAPSVTHGELALRGRHHSRKGGGRDPRRPGQLGRRIDKGCLREVPDRPSAAFCPRWGIAARSSRSWRRASTPSNATPSSSGRRRTSRSRSG